MKKLILISFLLMLGAGSAHGQVAGQSCAASGLNATNPATGLSFICTQVAGVLQWVQQPAGGGGGLTQVSVSPTTCALGMLDQLTTSPFAPLWCPQTNVVTSLRGTGGTVYATDFGVFGNAKWVCDATFTLNSPTVTTPVTDRPFLPTDSFAVVWGSTAVCGGNAQQAITNLTGATPITATYNSAHQITLSGNASANCTPTASQGGCALVWGPDDTTALQAAWDAAANSCTALVLPAGGIIVNALITNTTSLCPVTDAGDDKLSAVGVVGQGPFSTMLLFTSNVSFTTGMFAWGATPFYQRTYMHDFGVASFTSATAAQAGQIGFRTSFNSDFFNIWFMDFFPSAANNFIALLCNGVTNAVTNCHDLLMINAGYTAVDISADDENLFGNWIQGSTQLVTISGAARVKTWANRFALTGTHGAVGVTSGVSEWDSSEDLFDCTGTTLPCISVGGSAGTSVKFHNVRVSNRQTTGTGISISAGNTVIVDGEASTIASTTGTANAITNAGTLSLRNATISSTGGTGLSNSGTVTVKDSNTFNNAITNTGTIQGQPGQGVLQGACTGVVTSATTVGLYGLGQQSATTCTSTTVASGQVMSKAGSVYALYCTATAGNQATDACTVVKNGAAQTMTCSLNAAASCTDGAVAHVVTFVQGDILGIEVIGGTGTTLANVKGTLVTN